MNAEMNKKENLTSFYGAGESEGQKVIVKISIKPLYGLIKATI